VTEPIRVLCVDDCRAVADVAAFDADAGGERLAVERVDSSADAFDRLTDGGVDCVVAGDTSAGLGLLGSVRERELTIPFIVLSTGASADAAAAVEAGATDWFSTDSGRPELLTARIIDAVDAARARSATTERAVWEIEREREWLRSLFDALPSPVVHVRLVDGEPVVQRINPAFEETFGYGPDAALGSNLDELTVPADRRSEAEAINEQIPEARTLQREVRRETVDGRRSFLLSIGLSEEEDDALEGYAVYADITEQKQRETAITLLNELVSEFASCDCREEVYRQSVDAAQSLLEFDRAAIAVREGDQLRVTEMSDGMELDEPPTMALDEGVAGKTYRAGESFIVDDIEAEDDASPQTEMGSAMSVPIGDHGVLQVIDEAVGAFGEDDLELAELLVLHTEHSLDRVDRERELARQNERLEEFASFVSHDLRNPLNVANLRLDLVRAESENDHLDALAHALARMEERMDDLLARAREGERTGELESIELATIVKRSWSTVETGDAALECSTDCPVRADPGRLAAVLENLFRNAVEHGSTSPPSQAQEDAVEHSPTSGLPGADDGDSVTVRVGSLEGENGFYVEDDGPGIPAAERDRVFESGFSTADGTGLGLAIVHDIVDAHGWEIRVTGSDAGGARFEITGVDIGAH